MTFDVEDINNWFLFLSGKGIKDVTVNNELPAQFFSCQQLMHLKLQNCGFDPPPSFRGFPNLLSLDLYRVQFDDYKFEELITHCPLLESLRVNLIYGCQVKQVDIAKLEKLTMLSMSLEELDTRPLTSSRVIQLVASFPKLEELHLNVDITVDFFDDVPHHALSSSDLDCNTMGMLQLQSAVFVGSDCSENEVYLIKVFACLFTITKEDCYWDPPIHKGR